MDITKIFTTALQAEGKSYNTIKNYLVAVNQFLRAHNNDLDTITQESIDTFFSGFNPRNQTQNLKKNAINKFLTFLHARKRLSEPFSVKIKGISTSEPEYLSKDEQNRFFGVLQANPKHLRDFTIFATMLYTGMRISEVLNIQVKDIQEDHLVIRTSKTGAGKVYVRDKLIPILEEFLESLNPPLGRGDYIFQSKQHRRISDRMVQLLIKKYFRLAEIKKDLSPHSLRHTFAARLRESGSDIDIIQRTLRHKHIQSTMRYSHIKDKKLKDAVERSVKIPNKKLKIR